MNERMKPASRRALLALGTLLPSVAMAPGLSPAQREEVIELLRQSLREDPSILRDALAGLEQAEAREREAAQGRAIARHADALFRDTTDPVRGNPQGRVTLVEFFDVRCGYCKQLHPT